MAKKKPFKAKSDEKDKDFRKSKKGPGNRRTNFRSNHRSSQSTDSNLPEHDTRGDNDISYWNGAGQLYVDATTLSSYSALGAKHVSPYYQRQYYSPTGISRFDYVPFFGDIQSSIHPINTTAKIIYNAINAKNSRMPSYDPSDLMIYIIAVASAWSIHAWVRRLCGMFNTFSVLNRYWWEPICRSMGVAPISTDNDIVTWRNLANHMSLVLDRLPVPDGIKYFERTAWMNMNIYMDSPVGKSTYYYFNPAATFKYDYDGDKIGMLKLVETPWHAYTAGTSTDLVTPKAVEAFFFDLVSNIFNDSDIPVIGADIMKAFDGKVYSVGQIDSSFVLGPVYSPEVNLELHNSRVNYGGKNLWGDKPYDLKQNMTTNTIESGRVIWDMPGEVSTAFMATDMLGTRAIALDFPIDNPSNDDWMIATRLLWGAIPPDAAHINNYAVLVCGTEMLIGDEYFEFIDNDGTWELNGLANCALIGHSGTAVTLQNAINKIERASKLHDTPIMFLIQKNSNAGQYKEPTNMRMIDDLTNYTTISVEDLINLHDVAQISVFLPDWLRSTIGGK